MYSQEEIHGLVSQIEDLTSERPLFYLKFCANSEFADDVIAGRLYANTPKYFREQELRSGVRGQGDKNELALVLDAMSINAFDRDTGEHVFSLPGSTIRIKYNDDDQIPMVCFVGIPLRDMKFIMADENHAEFDFPFSEEEYDEMEEKFGAKCVLIGARELEARIQHMCKINEVEYLFDPVSYVPHNSLNKIQSYQQGLKERFLYKDEDLAYQREYRFALAAEMPEDHFINIGKLEGAKTFDVGELRTMRFSIKYESHFKEE